MVWRLVIGVCQGCSVGSHVIFDWPLTSFSLFVQCIFTDTCCLWCFSLLLSSHSYREVFGGESFEQDCDGWNNKISRLRYKGTNGRKGRKWTLHSLFLDAYWIGICATHSMPWSHSAWWMRYPPLINKKAKAQRIQITDLGPQSGTKA